MANFLVIARTSPSVTSEGLSVRVLLRDHRQVTGIKQPTVELVMADDSSVWKHLQSRFVQISSALWTDLQCSFLQRHKKKNVKSSKYERDVWT